MWLSASGMTSLADGVAASHASAKHDDLDDGSQLAGARNRNDHVRVADQGLVDLQLKLEAKDLSAAQPPASRRPSPVIVWTNASSWASGRSPAPWT